MRCTASALILLLGLFVVGDTALAVSSTAVLAVEGMT